MTMLTNTPRFAPCTPGVRRSFALVLARLGRGIDRWVAALIARRARHAALAALSSLDDRQLKDVGLYRTQISDAVFDSVEARRRVRRIEPF